MIGYEDDFRYFVQWVMRLKDCGWFNVEYVLSGVGDKDAGRGS